MLKVELSVAHQAQHSLEEQKAANLVLKDTIDRLRQDLDEIRNSHASSEGSAPSSLGAAGGSKVNVSKTKKVLHTLASEMGVQGATPVIVEEEATSPTASDGFEETVITTRRKRVSHILS